VLVGGNALGVITNAVVAQLDAAYGPKTTTT
jgi:hypothetical protein